MEKTGPALGLVADARYEENSIHLDIGDRLLLYTDGVIEGGQSAPTHEDLVDSLLENPDREDLLSKLYQAATKDIQGDQDDITMILVERGQGVSRFDDTPAPGERKQPQPLTDQVKLAQGVKEKQAFLSIAGNATWIRNHAFFTVANDLLERYDNLTLDLGACEYLDSTFLGTIHEIVMARPDVVKLQRVSGKIRALFEELSMDGVLNHTSLTSDPLPEKMEPLQSATTDTTEHGKRMLSAHETLASLSPENREVFQQVLDSLRADLEQGD
ncbi:MAG: hypothetical protein EP301_00540 [Gammaproteobacteria bacterium]|nr:MAG: hypothetical protein EP301_00540 [Gammaproteobacteria bacterium]